MNNLIRSIYFYLGLLILSFSLSSCGGGAATPAAPTTSQGKFIDAAVQGITYTSGGTTGLTGADGSFTYENGQSVTFSIGGITIGTASGNAIVTPVQLVSGAVNQTNDVVTNIVQFLLTIDDDHDPSNGIQITPAIRTAAAGLSVDFTLGATAFDTDNNVSNVVGILTTASSLGNQVLVSNSAAQTHLSGSLFSILSGNYSGTYSGTDSGNWTVNIAVDGTVSGSGTANFDQSSFSITGSVTTSGTTNATAVGNAGSSSWAGAVDITSGSLTGNWAGVGDNGTFSGSKN